MFPTGTVPHWSVVHLQRCTANRRRVATRGSPDWKAQAVDLTDRERAILDFESNWWTAPGPKEVAIVEKFELSGERYYRILSDLLESPAAEAYDPLVVKRLRRMRDRRRRARIEAAGVTSESRSR